MRGVRTPSPRRKREPLEAATNEFVTAHPFIRPDVPDEGAISTAVDGRGFLCAGAHRILVGSGPGPQNAPTA